jgi:hypothetical protein
VQRQPAEKPRGAPDPESPPKPKRPRDELGRPLPWGAEPRLELEDFDANPLETNHRLGIEHFNARRFFPAHEAWETCWKQGRGTPDQEFFKGLSQLGAGYVHYLRGNPHGAHTLLRRGAGRIERYGDEHLGVRPAELAAVAKRQAQAVEDAESARAPMPPLEFPTI